MIRILIKQMKSTQKIPLIWLKIIVVQLLSCIRLFGTPWTAWVCLSFTISCSSLKLMSIKSVLPSNRLVLCCLFLLLPSIFPSIRVFANESARHISWPKQWSFSFSISLSIVKYKILLKVCSSKKEQYQYCLHGLIIAV